MDKWKTVQVVIAHSYVLLSTCPKSCIKKYHSLFALDRRASEVGKEENKQDERREKGVTHKNLCVILGL